MVPAYARPAHVRLRDKLERIAAWNEISGLNPRIEGDRSLGIVTSGVATVHVREAAPQATVLQLTAT